MKKYKSIKIFILSLLGFCATSAIAEPITSDDVETLKWINTNIFGCDVKHGEITSRIIFAARVSDDLSLHGEQIESININGNVYRKNSEFSGKAGRNTHSLTMFFENYQITSYDQIPDYNWGKIIKFKFGRKKPPMAFKSKGKLWQLTVCVQIWNIASLIKASLLYRLV